MIICLSRMQQSALTMILVDHMRRPESTREWIDVVNDETVTLEDLFAVVAAAETANPFLQHFEQEVLPEVMSSAGVAVVLGDGLDSKICLEIGAAVMLSKRILVLATAAAVVPERLRRIAELVVEVGPKGTWRTEAAHVRIEKALDEFFGAGARPPIPEAKS